VSTSSDSEHEDGLILNRQENIPTSPVLLPPPLNLSGKHDHGGHTSFVRYLEAPVLRQEWFERDRNGVDWYHNHDHRRGVE